MVHATSQQSIVVVHDNVGKCRAVVFLVVKCACMAEQQLDFDGFFFSFPLFYCLKICANPFKKYMSFHFVFVSI